MPGNADTCGRRRGRGGRLTALALAAAALCSAGGCSLSGSGSTVAGVPHADPLAVMRVGGSALTTPAGTSAHAAGLPATGTASTRPGGSTPASSHSASSHPAAGSLHRHSGATSAPVNGSSATRPTAPAPAPPAPSTPTTRVQPKPGGPVGVSGDGGVVAAINADRARSGLAPVSGAFWQSAQNCAIKNLPTFTSHCLPSGMAGEVYAGMYSQSGSTAVGLWYGEGPGGEHYRIIMSPRVTRAYYGWAYDPSTGFYDVIVDFYTDGHSGI